MSLVRKTEYQQVDAVTFDAIEREVVARRDRTGGFLCCTTHRLIASDRNEFISVRVAADGDVWTVDRDAIDRARDRAPESAILDALCDAEGAILDMRFRCEER